MNMKNLHCKENFPCRHNKKLIEVEVSLHTGNWFLFLGGEKQTVLGGKGFLAGVKDFSFPIVLF